MNLELEKSHGAVALLSGGLDSTVNAAVAARKCDLRLALTFDYGQRAARCEIAASQTICRYLNIPHQVIEIPWLGRITQTALVEVDNDLPEPDPAMLDDPAAAEKTAEAVWVPNRNGIFLNIAAAFAESLGCRWVVPGFNAEEAKTFPDNSAEYVDALNRALEYSTRGKVGVHSFTGRLDKTGVFRMARDYGAPVWLSWSCYRDGDAPCGRCESCLRFTRALRESGCEAWYREKDGKGWE